MKRSLYIAASLYLVTAAACDPKPEKGDKTGSAAAIGSTSPVAALVTAATSRAFSGVAVAHFADASAPVTNPEPRTEVELGGTVVANGKPQAAALTISAGDCLAGGEAIAQLPVNGAGSFATELMVKRGSQLTLCAFVEGDAGESTLYGKAKGPYRVEGDREVEFEKIVVELKPGPAKRFAKARLL